MTGIGTISRCASIFDLYIQGEYELSPTDVSQKTGMSISTAARTLQALSEVNLLIKSTTRGKYRLGSKVLDMSQAYMSSLNLIDIAIPHLTALKDQVNESTAIYVRQGNERVIAGAVNCENKTIQRVLVPGTRSPIYAGSPSKVLLACLPDEEIERILKNTKLVKITEDTITSITALKNDINEIRKNGYAISKGEEVEYSYAIATSVFDQNGKVIAAIAIVGITLFLTNNKLEKKFITLVKETADNISRDLGYNMAVQKK